MADIDLVAGFNLVSMAWICLVLLKKGMSKANVDRFGNMYKDAEIRVVVNGEIGNAIKVKRCVRQGAPSSMLLFLYNMDPVLNFLERRLTGITLYRMPIMGPTLQGEDPLPPKEETYKIKGYADDLKAALKTMAEFLLLDMCLTVFEEASGCRVHRDENQQKCKVLLLGNWKKIKQEDIPVKYLKISDHLDMLGVTLKATFTTTRAANGDTVQKKCSDTINPWRIGRFMPLTDRGWSINTFALSKVWNKAHSVPFRQADLNHINKTIRNWLYSDLFLKPADIIKTRRKDEGGLNIFHVKSKSIATFIKSFIETAHSSKFIRSLYHQAILDWNVFDDRSIPDPGKNPYFSIEVFNIIRKAVDEGKNIVSMSSGDRYEFVVQPVIKEVGPDGQYVLIPCGVELQRPVHDWN